MTFERMDPYYVGRNSMSQNLPSIMELGIGPKSQHSQMPERVECPSCRHRDGRITYLKPHEICRSCAYTTSPPLSAYGRLSRSNSWDMLTLPPQAQDHESFTSHRRPSVTSLSLSDAERFDSAHHRTLPASRYPPPPLVSPTWDRMPTTDNKKIKDRVHANKECERRARQSACIGATAFLLADLPMDCDECRQYKERILQPVSSQKPKTSKNEELDVTRFKTIQSLIHHYSDFVPEKVQGLRDRLYQAKNGKNSNTTKFQVDDAQLSLEMLVDLARYHSINVDVGHNHKRKCSDDFDDSNPRSRRQLNLSNGGPTPPSSTVSPALSYRSSPVTSASFHTASKTYDE